MENSDGKNYRESERVKDVQLMLKDEARLYYFNCMKNNPDRIPSTWEEFKELIISIFSPSTVTETEDKLKLITYEGSVSKVITKFSQVLSEGENPTQEELIKLFLQCFPKALLKEAMEMDFKTWGEAGEFIRRKNTKVIQRWREWYKGTREQFKRQAERDEDCRMQGWVPQVEWPAIRNKVTESNLAKVPNYPRTTPFNRNFPNRTYPNNIYVPMQNRLKYDAPKPIMDAPAKEGLQNKNTVAFACNLCNGEGHRAFKCPTRDPMMRKPGNKCTKCGGKDHWAMHCPTFKPGKTASPAAVALPSTEQGNDKA